MERVCRFLCLCIEGGVWVHYMDMLKSFVRRLWCKECRLYGLAGLPGIHCARCEHILF